MQRARAWTLYGGTIRKTHIASSFFAVAAKLEPLLQVHDVKKAFVMSKTLLRRLEYMRSPKEMKLEKGIVVYAV